MGDTAIKPATKVLVVEDANFFSKILKRGIEQHLDLEAVCVTTLAEATEVLSKDKDGFFLALLDLNLPDSHGGEIVDIALENGIPSIVFTGTFNEELREDLLARGVIDYVPKDTRASLDYVLFLVERIHLNRSSKVLVVDDSRTARLHTRRLMELYQLTVFEAENGVAALEVLRQNPDIKMVIPDHVMPVMDGFELVHNIRQNYSRDELSIIGLSAYGNKVLSAKFMKYGANDFLDKPYSLEEMGFRVAQNLQMLDNTRRLREAATVDFLTGLYNRRFFFDFGRKSFAAARRASGNLVAAMIDIDYFKKVNDTHGHDVGDLVLKQVAAILDARFRENDVVARLGGEEFCVLGLEMSPENAFAIFDEVRRSIEATEIEVEGAEIRVTVSIGVCDTLGRDIDDMIATADGRLYKAKESGRNRVVMES